MSRNRIAEVIGMARDWKVTPAYRLLIKVGWGMLTLAVYGVVVGAVIGVTGAWWLAAGMAAAAGVLAALLPPPVPSELITERTVVNWRGLRGGSSALR